MRQGKITLHGRDYPLCLSTRALLAITERYGDIAGLFDVLNSDSAQDNLNAAMWVLAQMSKAGSRYAELNGENPVAPLTEDYLLDSCGADDLTTLMGAIMSTITNGTNREVEAEPPKNGGTTPAE